MTRAWTFKRAQTVSGTSLIEFLLHESNVTLEGFRYFKLVFECHFLEKNTKLAHFYYCVELKIDESTQPHKRLSSYFTFKWSLLSFKNRKSQEAGEFACSYVYFWRNSNSRWQMNLLPCIQRGSWKFKFYDIMLVHWNNDSSASTANVHDNILKHQSSIYVIDKTKA